MPRVPRGPAGASPARPGPAPPPAGSLVAPLVLGLAVVLGAVDARADRREQDALAAAADVPGVLASLAEPLEELWRLPTGPPTTGLGDRVVTVADGALVGLDGATGERRWAIPLVGDAGDLPGGRAGAGGVRGPRPRRLLRLLRRRTARGRARRCDRPRGGRRRRRGPHRAARLPAAHRRDRARGGRRARRLRRRQGHRVPDGAPARPAALGGRRARHRARGRRPARARRPAGRGARVGHDRRPRRPRRPDAGPVVRGLRRGGAGARPGRQPSGSRVRRVGVAVRRPLVRTGRDARAGARGRADRAGRRRRPDAGRRRPRLRGRGPRPGRRRRLRGRSCGTGPRPAGSCCASADGWS